MPDGCVSQLHTVDRFRVQAKGTARRNCTTATAPFPRAKNCRQKCDGSNRIATTFISSHSIADFDKRCVAHCKLLHHRLNGIKRYIAVLSSAFESPFRTGPSILFDTHGVKIEVIRIEPAVLEDRVGDGHC